MQVVPNYADLYIIKGIAFCESKKKEEGIATLRKAQELNDPRAEGLVVCSYCLYGSSDK